MTIWKILAICGFGFSLLLLGSAIGMSIYQDSILTIIAGIGTANFALLAIIVDQLKKR